MLNSILLIAACSFLNRVRGGLFPNLRGGRMIASAGIGVAAGLASGSLLLGAVTALGYLIWALPGWGLYFAAATGQWRKGEVEIAFIDRIGFSIVPFITSTRNWSNYRRGIICMGLRGGIFSWPLFFVLSCMFNPAASLIWPVFFLQGVNYFIAGMLRPNSNPIGLAEWMWGAVIGGGLALVIGTAHGEVLTLWPMQ